MVEEEVAVHVVDGPQSVPGPESLEDGCQTCFTFNDGQEIASATTPPQDTIGEEAGAIFPHNRLWNKKKLHVCFLNRIPPLTYEGHKYRIPNGIAGHVLDTSDILTLANHWSTELPTSIPSKERDCVPSFVSVTDPMNADIRVWFRASSEKGGSVTQIGTAATEVSKGAKEANATMFLKLNGDARYIEHLVMHEFGHALGLGHEHQRKVSGSNLRKFFLDSALKTYFGSQYLRDIAGYPDDDDHKTCSEYDADSIMHYWFHPSWLKPEYNTENKVEDHPGISEDERKVLRAIFQREKKGLAEHISETDHTFVVKAYYNGSTSIPEDPQGFQDKKFIGITVAIALSAAAVYFAMDKTFTVASASSAAAVFIAMVRMNEAAVALAVFLILAGTFLLYAYRRQVSSYFTISYKKVYVTIAILVILGLCAHRYTSSHINITVGDDKEAVTEKAEEVIVLKSTPVVPSLLEESETYNTDPHEQTVEEPPPVTTSKVDEDTPEQDVSKDYCEKYSKYLLSKASVTESTKYHFKGDAEIFGRSIHFIGKSTVPVLVAGFEPSEFRADIMDVMKPTSNKHSAEATSTLSVQDAVEKALIRLCEKLKQLGIK